LVFVTISIHSWLLFTLISCRLAISEEMPLKSIISFSWIKFLEYPLSQLKPLKLVQRCVNWKDIVISSIPFSGWYDPMWIMSISFIFLSVPQVFPRFFHNSLSYQNRSIRSSFGHRICLASSPDSSKFFCTYPVICLDMSGLSAKISIWIKNLHFGLSLPSILIYVIMWRFCDAYKGKWVVVEEVFVMDYLSMWSWAKLLPITGKRSSNQVILK
jgi:hypothetical protein